MATGFQEWVIQVAHQKLWPLKAWPQKVYNITHKILWMKTSPGATPDSKEGETDSTSWWASGKFTLQKSSWDGSHGCSHLWKHNLLHHLRLACSASNSTLVRTVLYLIQAFWTTIGVHVFLFTLSANGDCGNHHPPYILWKANYPISLNSASLK